MLEYQNILLKITYYDVVGYISIIFSILAFLSENKTKSRFYGMISTILLAFNLYFYNGMNGVFVSVISFLTKLLSLKIEEEKLNILKYSSPFIAFIFFFYFNEEGILGILPAISLIFIIFADLQKDVLKMKIIYFGSAISWLIYRIVINSIPAIIFDVVGIIILSYVSIKLYKERKKLKNNKVLN